MSNEHHRRCAADSGEAAEELQEMLARDGVESGAGLVEDHEARRRHQRASDQHALALPLREKSPRTIAEISCLDAAENGVGGAEVLVAHLAPITDLRVASADDSFESGLAVVHHLMHA